MTTILHASDEKLGSSYPRTQQIYDFHVMIKKVEKV